MRILNLYAGIGGNRKLWGGALEVIAVENVPEIAQVYQDLFPDDKVIVADAHQYLLDHFKEFDFIWSSPPCPTHSDIRRAGVHRGQYGALYPDMTLYQEIILLTHFAPFKTKWVVENVVPYYKPLIEAQTVGRHLFWSNFYIQPMEIEDGRVHNDITGNSTVYGVNLEKYGVNLEKYGVNEKRKILRNMVNPEVGKWVFEQAFKEIKTLL